MLRWIAAAALIAGPASAQDNCGSLYRAADAAFAQAATAAAQEVVNRFMLFEMGSAADDEARAAQLADNAAAEISDAIAAAYLARRERLDQLARVCG